MTAAVVVGVGAGNGLGAAVAGGIGPIEAVIFNVGNNMPINFDDLTAGDVKLGEFRPLEGNLVSGLVIFEAQRDNC